MSPTLSPGSGSMRSEGRSSPAARRPGQGTPRALIRALSPIVLSRRPFGEGMRLQGPGTTIVIADDHPLFRGALRQAIASLMPESRVVEANGMEELNGTLATEKEVDLVLLDLTMPDVQGFSGLISLRAQHPELPVVIVSANEEPVVIRRAIEFGASGFIPKSLNVDAIGTAIAAVLAGDTWTPPDIALNAAEDKETANLVRRLATLTPQQVRVLM